MPNEVVKYPISPKVIINEAPIMATPNYEKEYVTLTQEAEGVFSYHCDNKGSQRTNAGPGSTENLSTNKKNSLGQDNEKSERTEYSSKQMDISGRSQFVVISSQEGKNIFAHPKETKKLIEESVFGDYLNGDIEVRGRGRSIKIGIKIKTDIDLAKVTKIGDHPVAVWSPLTNNQSVGVISPISKNLDVLKDVLPNLRMIESENPDRFIITGKRIGNKKNLTDLVKITFQGNLPDKIMWDNQSFKVRQFYPNPALCFRCQKYGHGSNSCTSKILCPFCGDSHWFKECPNKSKENIEPKCQHCKLNHLTGTKSCIFYKKASQVEKCKQDRTITYEESKKLYRNINENALDELNEYLNRPKEKMMKKKSEEL